MKQFHLQLFVLLYFTALTYLAITTPITPYEANILYGTESVVQSLMRLGREIDDSFWGMRFFSQLFGFITVFLFYRLSLEYFNKRENAYLATLIFMLLPGVMTAITLVNVSIIVLPVILLFVLFYQRGVHWVLPFLMFALYAIHEASVIFFVATLLYAIAERVKFLVILSLTFLIAFLLFSKGLEIGGFPSGHFIDIFGLYATIFSPFLFLYFFYTLYRIFLRGNKDLIWYIAFTALIFSLLLSIRQKVDLTDFAPYVLIAIILMVKVYKQSVGVRLPKFRTTYRRGFYVVFFFLVTGALITVFHQFIYYYSGYPKQKHFAKTIYRTYDHVRELREQNLSCSNEIRRKSEVQQYRYYGISPCKE